MANTARAEHLPEPRVVYVSTDRDGSTVRPSTRIYIGHETRSEFDTLLGTMEPQIVQLLTGLSEDRLEKLGGVVFRDPSNDRELARFPATARRRPRAR